MQVGEAWGKAIDFIRRRKVDYGMTFGSPAGKRVLADIAKFCRATETTFSPDPRIHAALEGRREVYLRIERHLNLTSQQLYDIFNAKQQ